MGVLTGTKLFVWVCIRNSDCSASKCSHLALFLQITSTGMSLLYLAVLCKCALKKSIVDPSRVALCAN